MNDKFTLSSAQQKKFILGSVVGLVLVVVGLVLAGMNIGGEHHDDHATGDHASLVLADASGSNGALQDGHGEAVHGEGQDEHAEGASHHAPTTFKKRLGAVFLTGNWYFFALSVFGVFLLAVSYVANAGWYVVVKRIWETYYRYLPIALLLLVGCFFIFGEIYEWNFLHKGVDDLIDHKRPFLNGGVYAVLVGGAGLFYAFIAHMFRKQSIAEDSAGGLKNHKSSTKFAALFLPVFALSFSFITFIVLMSLEPHWYSTIYAVYCFAGMFVMGMTMTALIAIDLKEQGYLKELSADHLHDIGKYMFAFSIFWAYIWLSQYLLIWYANIPEEGHYYLARFENYNFLFWINLVINFIFPFLAFMTRDAKRQMSSLKKVGMVILFGRFLDIFLLVMPGAIGADWNFGIFLAAIGMVLFQGGIWLLLIYKGLEAAPLLPRNHPYLEESFHHDTGI